MRHIANGVIVALLAVAPAFAKDARCFTTDDGEYPCAFKATDRSGSFEISAEGFPTYTLVVNSPGVAAAFANFGDRNVALPGLHRRAEDDPACWVSDSTDTRICAW